METRTWTQEAAADAVYIRPQPRPASAEVWFFTRLGGVSPRPYDSLNVSTKVGDSKENVSRNLARIGVAMNDRPTAWVRQVAGDDVVCVEKPGFHGAADAMFTCEESLPLAVAVADCVPVALVGERGVAMVHSGWRGTLAGISGKTARRMGEDPARLKAYIGPSIRDCCYEVSEELATRFVSTFGTGVACGRQLSLQEAIARDLRNCGVGEVVDLGLCTGCRGDLFFSHRRQGPYTGRNLAAVARRTKR